MISIYNTLQIIITVIMAENDKNCHNIEKKIQRNHIMKSMNISLPDTMRDYIEEQVAQGGYSSVSEYFRELVRQDQKQRANERLQTMLLEGLNSGNATEMTAQDWEDIRQAVREKTNKRQSAI
ncbi:type II toxin-antitoxin system ParD family antitoxin [Aphanizomenon flos-aquae]